MIVRWGLEELPGALDDVGIDRPLLVASPRWDRLAMPAAARWNEIPSDRIAVPPDVDGILSVGGGSAIDTAKAASAASDLPLVSVPTTYSGAEWTGFFGVRTPERRQVGSGAGARLAGIVYDPELTLDLPRKASGGTALNALAHCVEALYPGELEAARRGASTIDEWLPRVLENGSDLEARTRLLEGARDAGQALAERGLYLGHAMAQAVGGRYGIPHGASNALCLAPAMRFNAPVVPWAMTAVPVERVEELARLAGFGRLRDLGVPVEDLAELGAAARSGRERRRTRGRRAPRRSPSCTARSGSRGARVLARRANEGGSRCRKAVLTSLRRDADRLSVVAVIYWVEPAKSLPGFFAGHDRLEPPSHEALHAPSRRPRLLAFAWFERRREDEDRRLISYWQAIVLGLLQGFTELCPISSLGHI